MGLYWGFARNPASPKTCGSKNRSDWPASSSPTLPPRPPHRGLPSPASPSPHPTSGLEAPPAQGPAEGKDPAPDSEGRKKRGRRKVTFLTWPAAWFSLGPLPNFPGQHLLSWLMKELSHPWPPCHGGIVAWNSSCCVTPGLFHHVSPRPLFLESPGTKSSSSDIPRLD